jgi:hypothetical protein
MRRSLRIGLLLVAALCVLMFLSVRTEKVEADVATERQVVGLPFSPWAEYVSRREVVRDEQGNTTDRANESFRVLWVSWSWLLLVGAVVGVLGFRRVRPVRPVEEGAAW